MVEMTQSHKCGGVVTDEIFNLPVGFGASLWVSISCLLHGNQPDLLIPFTNTLNKKKQRTKKWDSTPKKLHPIALVYVHRTQG